MSEDQSAHPALRRYSLAELSRSVAMERRSSAFANEQVDQLEINRIFAARKSTPKSAKSAKPVQPLEMSMDSEQRELLDRLKTEKDVRTLDQMVLEKVFRRGVVCREWSDHVGFPYVDPFQSIVTEEALEKIPVDIAKKASVLPLYLFEGVLTLAMAEPANEALVKRIAAIADCEISPVFALPSDIASCLDVHYTRRESLDQTIESFEIEHGRLEKTLEKLDVSELADSKPVAAILDTLLYYAIRERASDIHLEPFEAAVRIRLRVDGRLREVKFYPHVIHRAVTARLKVLSKLNVSESRFPQDGRFAIPLGSGNASFRVSVRPVSRGQNVVIRVLGSAGRKRLMSLDDMLISEEILSPYRQVIQSPNGLIFVTGPTGSGKTSLLYASLQEINDGSNNVTTIEDPIEIELPGITQSQVNSHIDLSFPILLRSMLRQDPDIILIGEIRDLETARIATEAALTGHLVFATLHTNNAIQAVVRLVEIGIEPYMVAPSINAVLAQRLAPRLNPRLREAYVPSAKVLDEFFDDWDSVENFTFYRPRPDAEGASAGFQGRIAFHELALVSERMRSLIGTNAGTLELLEAAEEMGYRPLRYDGLRKALLGLTTIEEVARATPQEWRSA